MVPEMETRVVAVTVPVAIVDNASWTTIEIDTAPDGVPWDFCSFYFMLGATDIAMAALKIQESDTSGSGMADITGAIFGTSTNTDGDTSALPTALEDGLIFGFDIDLRGRKRYLDMTATGGDGAAGAYGAAWAVLSRPKQGPITAAKRGCSQMLRV